MATIKQERAAKEMLKVIQGKSECKTKKELLEKVSYGKISKQPSRILESKGYQEVLNKYLPDDLLAEKHKELLNATGIDHMVFPVAMTDEEITELLVSVNCKPKKFMHGDTANHVWFWARDNNALKNALDLAYKVKGSYAPEKSQNINVNANISVENIEKLKEIALKISKEIKKEYAKGDIQTKTTLKRVEKKA